MTLLTIAHLGPTGTNTESAALAYQSWRGEAAQLLCSPTISETLKMVATGRADLGVVPVENSLEGGVAATLDTLWELEGLHIHWALVMPIVHVLVSAAATLEHVREVYSHPQALGQCQQWLGAFLPQASLVPTASTTEVLGQLPAHSSWGAIVSPRAAQLYQLPVLAGPINDRSGNYTRFWVVGGAPPLTAQPQASLAFSLPRNTPGALVQALEIFARRQINLRRIESRPTKRSLGEYLFFLDLTTDEQPLEAALEELQAVSERVKLLGVYGVIKLEGELA